MVKVPFGIASEKPKGAFDTQKLVLNLYKSASDS